MVVVSSARWVVVAAAAVAVAALGCGAQHTKDNMRLGDTLRWPDGAVTYHLGANLTDEMLRQIKEVVESLEAVTCLRFTPLLARPVAGLTPKVLYIRRGRSCFYEKVGPDGSGSVLLKLNKKCSGQRGALLHMFLHVLGVRHEHQRYDRNFYITVNHHNIAPALVNQYMRHSWGVSYVASAGLPYDYTSVMHHKADAFAVDASEPVLWPLVPCARPVIGQQKEMSRSDVARLNRLYGCEKHYLGDDIIGAVPYLKWRRHASRLRQLQDHRRW